MTDASPSHDELESVEGLMACWRVFGLDRDFGDRPASGWSTNVVLADGAELSVHLGEIPQHVINGIRGRWAHGIFQLNTFGNHYAGHTVEEIQESLAAEEAAAEQPIQAARGNHKLWLTIEVRKPVKVAIWPEVRFLYTTEEIQEELRNFAKQAEICLDQAFLQLQPSLGPTLVPTRLTTDVLHPHLFVPGRATFGIPSFELKAHVGAVSTTGWKDIDFAAVESSISRGLGLKAERDKLCAAPNRWLLAALSQKADSLRTFLFAFVGLEALVNKTAAKYETSILAVVSKELGFPMEHLAWPSPRDSDSPWRNLVFRFSLLALWLDPEGAVGDVDEFKDLAAERNGMAHGKIWPGDTENLPGDRAVALLRKYIGLVAVSPDPGALA